MKIKLLLSTYVLFFVGFMAIPGYAQQMISITNVKYADGTSLPSGSSIRIIDGTDTTISFDLGINNPQMAFAKGGILTVQSKYSSNSTLEHVRFEFGLYAITGSISKKCTITLRGNHFPTGTGAIYAQFSPMDGPPVTGTSVPVKVYSPISSNTISADRTIFEGEPVGVITGSTPRGGDANYTYTWQRRIDGGVWTTIAGVTNPSYEPTITTVSTIFYRRIVTSLSGSLTSTSNEVLIRILPNIPIQNNTIALSGSNIQGSTPTGGTGSYTYRWYANLVDGEDWALLQGTGKDFSIPDYVYGFAESQGHELFIYREVKSGSKIVNSQVVRVFPLQPIQSNEITLNGSSILGNLPTGGTGSYTYKWYANLVDGEDWALLQGTSKDLSIPDYVYGFAESQGHELFIYREVKSGNKISNSKVVKISPLQPIENNTITIDGLNIAGSSPTGGTGNYRYEYYSYLEFPDGEIEGPSMMEGTGQNYTFSVKPSPIIKFYRRVVSGNKSSNSNVVSFPAAKSATNKAALSENSISDLTVYPNPTSESLNFVTNFTTDQNIEIILYSEKLGNEKSVYKGKVAPNQVVNWSIPANYQKGLYFYKIISENKEVKSGKVIFN